MKNRLYVYICIFVVLEVLRSSVCRAKVIDDTRRTKREISVAETSQSKGDADYAKEINLEHEKIDKDIEENSMYQDDTKKKRKISKKTAGSVNSIDFHPSNVEESLDRDNVFSYPNAQRSNEKLEENEEADEEAIKRECDKNEGASNLVRLPRNINSDFNRYTDQDERASLYDDYEAKDVAKRGVLSGSEDYEEMEDDSPGIEDMAAIQESTKEGEKRETLKDARVKRDQAEILETFEKSKLNPDNPANLEEPKTAAKNPYTREVSHIELSKSFNEALVPDTVKGFGSKGVISKLNGSSKIEEPASIVASSKKDESNAEYEKRVEEEIQRKIDSIKEEIRRDIEAQQRIRDIQDNNVRFDELQDQEHEDEERQNFEDKSIEKRQIISKRSIRQIVDATPASKKNEKKRSLRREQQHKKRKHRSSKIDNLDTSKENKILKRRAAANHDKFSDHIPSKELFKRKRARQIFLVNNNQHQTKKRQLRSYTLPSDRSAIKSENELFMNPALNSYLHTDNRRIQLSSPVGSEDENNEEEQSRVAEHSDSLVSLTGSSQELNPRLEKEYKEAFGGLQSEPGNALARFKRIKRVLTSGPDAKI